jgi:hypothetical protein
MEALVIVARFLVARGSRLDRASLLLTQGGVVVRFKGGLERLVAEGPIFTELPLVEQMDEAIRKDERGGKSYIVTDA